MNSDLLQKLKDWRTHIANLEGIEPFRVFANKVLENIAELKPSNKEELMALKGIRDKKFAKYGRSILELVNGASIGGGDTHETGQDKKPYTISGYLNFLNTEFKKHKARIQGEVSSLDIRDGYLFFSLKDKDDESVLSCFMWRTNYELCGVALGVGMEIIVDGLPEIYAPSGRFNFRVSTIELVGEGELKKAYDRLKQKLEREGLFAVEKKKPIPEYPQRIGLITSESGAVIHDFLNNLGKYGYRITFVNSRVEGQTAVRSLLSAIEYFNNKSIDVLVIIRGGGSLESLQAFNNEALVRKIADFKVPVICGIGHDKDIPLASSAADQAVSTPTAVATLLNWSWKKVINDIFATEKDVIYKYQRTLDGAVHRVESFPGDLIRFFKGILQDAQEAVSLFPRFLLGTLEKELENNSRMLDDMKKRLEIFDPARQLKLGYSIVYFSGKVVKTVKQVRVGEKIDIKVTDGSINSVVKNINNL